MQARLRVSLLLLLCVLGVGLSQVAHHSSAAEDQRIYLPLVRSPSAPANSLAVSAATHLGGPEDDSARAVDVAPDGSVVVGGIWPTYNPPGTTPVTLLNGGAGVVIRFDRSGRTVRSLARVGGSVADLEIDPQGTIAVCGDFGVAALDATASSVRWNATPGAASRCAVGSDGTVAVLVGNSAHVYSNTGALLKSWAIGVGTANDIAVDGANQNVIATGFVQISGNLQIPFIHAWAYDGALRWKSYDFPAGSPNLGSADTRGERIAIGRDGRLYFAASINGGTGASVLTHDPKDSTKDVGSRIVVTDEYTNPFNIGSVKMAWFARFNPLDGSLELAQSLLTRLGDDKGRKGNSITVAGMMADADGTLYLAGGAAAFIANRDAQSVGGVRVGPYGGDAFALVVSPDFKQRRIWTVFTAPGGGSGGAAGISIRNGVAALVATPAQAFITFNAVQPTSGGGKDAYLAVWPTN